MCLYPKCECMKKQAEREGIPEDQLKNGFQCLQEDNTVLVPVPNPDKTKQGLVPMVDPSEQLRKLLLNSKNPIKFVEVDRLQDRDLLELCRHRFDEMEDPYLFEIFKRFETYMRVQSIFYRLQQRDTKP